MNVLGLNNSSSNVFNQDLNSGSSPEFQNVCVENVKLKGQDVDIENLEADDGVVFYDRAAKRAKLSTSDGVVSTTKTLADTADKYQLSSARCSADRTRLYTQRSCYRNRDEHHREF
jgi:hypothetical protein